MKKRFIALVGSAVMLGSVVAAGCGGKKEANDTLTVAFLSGGRGETYVQKLLDGFKETDYVKDFLKSNNLTALKTNVIKGGGDVIADTVNNSINTGTTPDVLFLNYNVKKSPTEAFVRNKQLVNLDTLLEENVYNETTKLKDKLVPGLLENYTTKPYGDSVYTLPAFYSPTGLWYDSSRFNENGTDGKYKIPATWAEFWALGDTLNEAIAANGGTVDAAHPALFTYPTAGYFDGFIYSAIAGMAGEEKFMKTLGYEDGIWKDTDVMIALEVVVKLRDYIEPNTVAQANNNDFQNNQQAVIGKADGSAKGTALFIPNGDWLPGEMAESTPTGYEWGFTALPAKDAETKSYVNTYLENVYVHKNGKNTELGKQFLLYYYSNEGAKIVAEESKAIIPTADALTNATTNGVPAATTKLYDAYKGNGAVSGSFVSTGTVTGLDWNEVLYGDLNDKVFNSSNKNKTVAELLAAWTDRIEAASDQLRAKIVK